MKKQIKYNWVLMQRANFPFMAKHNVYLNVINNCQLGVANSLESTHLLPTTSRLLSAVTHHP